MMIALALRGRTRSGRILLSETVRRKIRVFIHKNFYQNKYDYRNQWLQFTDRLAASQKAATTSCARSSWGSATPSGWDAGALFLVDHERASYQQAAGIAIESAPVAFREEGRRHRRHRRRHMDRRPPGNAHYPEIGDADRNCSAANAVSFIIPLVMNEAVDGFIVLGRPVNTRGNLQLRGFRPHEDPCPAGRIRPAQPAPLGPAGPFAGDGGDREGFRLRDARPEEPGLRHVAHGSKMPRNTSPFPSSRRTCSSPSAIP